MKDVKFIVMQDPDRTVYSAKTSVTHEDIIWIYWLEDGVVEQVEYTKQQVDLYFGNGDWVVVEDEDAMEDYHE